MAVIGRVISMPAMPPQQQMLPQVQGVPCQVPIGGYRMHPQPQQPMDLSRDYIPVAAAYHSMPPKKCEVVADDDIEVEVVSGGYVYFFIFFEKKYIFDLAYSNQKQVEFIPKCSIVPM